MPPTLPQQACSTEAVPQPLARTRQLTALAPLVIGLVSARTGITASIYSSYTQTDANFLSDGTSLFASLVLVILLAIIALKQIRFKKSQVNAIEHICIALQVVSVVALGLLPGSGLGDGPLYYIVGTINAVISPCSIFYWVRRARQSSAAAAAVFVFAAILLSEMEMFACSLLSEPFRQMLAAAFAALQIPAMMAARHVQKPYAMAPSETGDSLSFMKVSIKNKGVLVSSALGVAALGVTIGLLRGYPNGEAVAFDDAHRFAYMALTIALCLFVIVLSLKGRQAVLTTGIWILMFALACLALTAYAAWGDNLQIGAVFATTLNALMVGYCLHLTISFMTYGWRDPYYYAIAGWLAFFLPRAIGRIVLSSTYPLNTNTELMLAIMGDAVLVSALLVFIRFLRVANMPERTLPAPESTTLQKLMSLSDADEIAAATAVRQTAIRQGVADIGSRYALSAREIEVLALYVLGHTQKRIGDELFIAPGTVHEHIRHIYTKTGMHSRQEILDFVGNAANRDEPALTS